MALRKDELDKPLNSLRNQKEAIELAGLESRIDEGLLESYGNGMSTLTFLLEKAPSEWVKAELKRRYGEAGWIIEFIPIPRDQWSDHRYIYGLEIKAKPTV